MNIVHESATMIEKGSQINVFAIELTTSILTKINSYLPSSSVKYEGLYFNSTPVGIFLLH